MRRAATRRTRSVGCSLRAPSAPLRTRMLARFDLRIGLLEAAAALAVPVIVLDVERRDRNGGGGASIEHTTRHWTGVGLPRWQSEHRTPDVRGDDSSDVGCSPGVDRGDGGCIDYS